MIKNVFFDVDNTIVDSGVENAIYYKEALQKLGYNPNRFLELYNIIDKYEKTFNEKENFYKEKDMIDFINKELNENYDVKLIDEINNVIAKYWINKIYLDEETLMYLYNKYDLYIFSNWFYDATYNRLRNIGYLKYFKKVFTADKYGSKPYKSSFENILSEINVKPEECVMIGDSMRTDILGATNARMQAIWFNQAENENIFRTEVTKYTEIVRLDELKKIL